MPKYTVEIETRDVYQVDVEAENEQEAEAKVENMEVSDMIWVTGSVEVAAIFEREERKQ